ncbi:MAG: hypothetical protein IJV65_04635 [Kiritimatiellae bacterium]|nr:hypothetical protein [Kiritimatiellia bacterium]
MNDEQDKKRMWRIGIVTTAHPTSSDVSRPMDTEAAVAALANLSNALPPGVRAFAFASGPDDELANGVAIAVTETIADLASFGKSSSDIYGDWYGYDVIGRVRFDEESRAAQLDRAERENGKLRSKVRNLLWYNRNLRIGFCALAVLFLALAAATAWSDFRGKPALQEQAEQRDEDGHQQAVAARGEAGEDPALLAGALLGVEGLEAGVGKRAERDAGRNGLEGANNVPPDELCVDERGGDLEDGGVGAVGKIPLAGLGAEDAVFDVVHAGESSTGTDKLSVGTKRTE